MMTREELEQALYRIAFEGNPDADQGAILKHDTEQRAVIERLDQLTTLQAGGIRSLHEQIVQKDAEIAELKEREQVAVWYETLVTRARIGTAITPSLKAYIEQLEAELAAIKKEHP